MYLLASVIVSTECPQTQPQSPLQRQAPCWTHRRHRVKAGAQMSSPPFLDLQRTAAALTFPRPVPAAPQILHTGIPQRCFGPDLRAISVAQRRSPWRLLVQQGEEGASRSGGWHTATSKHVPYFLAFLRQIVGCVFIN